MALTTEPTEAATPLLVVAGFVGFVGLAGEFGFVGFAGLAGVLAVAPLPPPELEQPVTLTMPAAIAASNVGRRIFDMTFLLVKALPRAQTLVDAPRLFETRPAMS
ncbi:hypothetical protein C266_25525 [Pandoraea sp. SD6-2]|nr:hypothetical protein C266_25525 [Pandoraea sp. SD6-2]